MSNNWIDSGKRERKKGGDNLDDGLQMLRLFFTLALDGSSFTCAPISFLLCRFYKSMAKAPSASALACSGSPLKPKKKKTKHLCQNIFNRWRKNWKFNPIQKYSIASVVSGLLFFWFSYNYISVGKVQSVHFSLFGVYGFIWTRNMICELESRQRKLRRRRWIQKSHSWG